MTGGDRRQPRDRAANQIDPGDTRAVRAEPSVSLLGQMARTPNINTGEVMEQRGKKLWSVSHRLTTRIPAVTTWVHDRVEVPRTKEWEHQGLIEEAVMERKAVGRTANWVHKATPHQKFHQHVTGVHEQNDQMSH